MVVVHIWINKEKPQEQVNKIKISAFVLPQEANEALINWLHMSTTTVTECVPLNQQALTYKKTLRATSLPRLIKLLSSYWSNSHVALLASACLVQTSRTACGNYYHQCEVPLSLCSCRKLYIPDSFSVAVPCERKYPELWKILSDY